MTDLRRSATRYGRLMRPAEGGSSIGMRLRRHCAGSPDLTGHDVAAVHVERREVPRDVQRQAPQVLGR